MNTMRKPNETAKFSGRVYYPCFVDCIDVQMCGLYRCVDCIDLWVVWCGDSSSKQASSHKSSRERERERRREKE